MKKVLSFVLVLSMILGSFGMAFAAPADVKGMECEDAVNALVELGVIAGYKDGSFKPENVVTRAEAATFIIKAMGLADYAVEKSSFSDMAGHWADPFVAYAASLGFVKGNTDGTFAPDATVTSDQMITMLVQAVGYKGEYLVGGYPGAFVNQAKTLGILDGVKSGSMGCSRADVATMLFNTLDVQFVRYTKDGALDETALNTPDYMLLRLGGKTYNGGQPFIAGVGVHDSLAKEYQGAYVVAYADEDGDVLAVKEVKSVFLTGKMNVAGTKFVADDVEYTVNEGYLTPGAVTTTTGSVYFENGVAKNNTTEVAVQTDTVTIAAKVSGKTIKEVYSVSKWIADGGSEMIDEYQLDAIDAATPGLLSGTFKLDDNEEIDLTSFELVGVDSLADIKEDHIVYVYTDGTNITKIAVGTEVVTGTVAKRNTADSEITVNGKVYAFAGETNADDIDDVVVGNEYDFYLDANGDIFFADQITATADNYGVVIDIENGSTGLRANEALIKLVMADGKAKTFAIDGDAFDDDEIATSAATVTNVATYVTKASVDEVKGIVKYNVNEAGKIDKIAYVSNYTTAGGADVDITAKGTFDGRKITSDVVILSDAQFTTTGSISDDSDDFAAVTRANALGLEDVEAGYVTNTKGEIVFMIINANGDSEDVVYGFAVKEEEISDGEDGEDYEVTFYVNGAKKVFVADAASEFDLGATTLYAIVLDADGYAVDKTGVAKVDESSTVNVNVTGTATKVADDKVYVGSAWTITLDADAVVYKHNNDGDMVVGTKGDIRNKVLTNGADTEVVFYDLDGDAVADIVMIL